MSIEYLPLKKIFDEPTYVFLENGDVLAVEAKLVNVLYRKEEDTIRTSFKVNIYLVSASSSTLKTDLNDEDIWKPNTNIENGEEMKFAQTENNSYYEITHPKQGTLLAVISPRVSTVTFTKKYTTGGEPVYNANSNVRSAIFPIKFEVEKEPTAEDENIERRK